MENPNQNSVDYNLLGKYLAGECSPSERQQVEAWLQSEENLREFEVLQAMWESADAEPALVDVDQAWKRVGSHVAATQPPVAVQGSGRSLFRILPLVAAGMAILVLTYFIFRPGAEPVFTEYANATQEAQPYTFPDGSVATLRPGSSVKFVENFAGAERGVTLKGEAFFEVAKNPEKPFVIDVEGVEVKVLGTSFNIDPTDGVEVKVATGKVKLSAPVAEAQQASSVVLEAGMAARYDESTSEIVEVRKVTDNEFFWVKKRLEYRDVPMKEVAKDLRRHYKVRLDFGLDLLKDCRLTATFENQSIDSILLVIQESFNLTVTQDGQKYLLEGIGC